MIAFDFERLWETKAIELDMWYICRDIYVILLDFEEWLQAQATKLDIWYISSDIDKWKKKSSKEVIPFDPWKTCHLMFLQFCSDCNLDINNNQRSKYNKNQHILISHYSNLCHFHPYIIIKCMTCVAAPV